MTDVPAELAALRTRVSAIESRLNAEVSLRAMVDLDLATVTTRLGAQHRLLLALSETQSDHTRMLREQSEVLNAHSRLLGEHSLVLADHTQRLGRIEDRTQRIEDRTQRIEDRTQRIEDRMERVEDRMERVEDRMERVETGVQTILDLLRGTEGSDRAPD